MIISLTYVVAALAIYVAAIYLVYRLEPRITASSILICFLFLIYGPPYIAYMLFRRPISAVDYLISSSVDFDQVVIGQNLSIALMFVSVIAGIELLNVLMASSILKMQENLRAWNKQPLTSSSKRSLALFSVVLGLAIFMGWTSYREGHFQTLSGYLSVPGDEFAKIAYRQQHGGSQSYLYNCVAASVAPMMIVWAALAGWAQRWWALLAAAALLVMTTLLAKLETLNKAPSALFLLQLGFVGYLLFRNNLNWRIAVGGLAVTILIFVPIFQLAIPGMNATEALGFFYYRAFDYSNAALLEYFGAFPWRLHHMWGANIRWVATLLNWDWTPSYDVVARLWRSAEGTHTTAMFIADAWVDFSYAGVVIYSIVAGAVCRAIDAVFLKEGKTTVAVAALAAAFIGVYNLMISALPTSMLSGGLGLPLIVALLLGIGKRLRREEHGEAADAVPIVLETGTGS
ncbi:hypothetical protein [Bradyrhizobium sp. BWC-3-1]|uniref:hypothetical protein n=1 Tax=Bradyrhizobium sp. BWC-3-1 TaxID=3080012 RepID=UPI00293EC7D3|nr:hypothetical protein [Bradyrhizobium sp. BWC-3-1]WOH61256.1 hypothetical protein RX329_14605 [Bradyrhizobium sp. BWC-3-1]